MILWPRLHSWLPPKRAETAVLEVFRPEQMLSEAWARTALGDRKAARRLRQDAAALADAQGQPLVAVHVHHAGVRTGDHAAACRLLETAPCVGGTFASAARDHARALLDGDAAGMSSAAEAFVRIGAHAQAADAFAQASRRAEHCGADELARQLTTSVLAEQRAVGGLDTPAIRSIATGMGLTRRQQHVARLAATGRSNREIADELGISIRTVESHLDAAFRRLGISTRHALASRLLGSPTVE